MENTRIQCDLQHDATVNYAMQQNHVPIVKRLRLTNTGDAVTAQMTVRIVTEPDFAAPWEMSVSPLQPGQMVDLGAIDLLLSPSFLASLTERLAGELVVTVMVGREPGVCSDSDSGNKSIPPDGVLIQQRYPIDVLAFDEWGGLRALPEMIAAFVTPNHPLVAGILRDSSELLKAWSGDPSITGYQTRDPNRVRLQMAAIFAALKAKEIAYSVPPASFEQQGQKIRTPDEMFTYRLGTCLDLAVLYASCAEAAGLNSLVVFVEGHAFPGVWLLDACFADTIQDDVTLITKRIAPGVQEICVLEATSLVLGRDHHFEQAVALGESNLTDPARFHFLVDIRRSRMGNIRPLPVRGVGRAAPEGASEEQRDGKAGSDVPPELEAVTQIELPETGRQPERTRLDQWERKLLDLSLRNPLLNFRPTSGGLPLLSPTLSALEDALAGGQDFQIAPRPLDWEGTPRDQTVYRRRTNSDPVTRLLAEEFARHRLRTELTADELSVRMTRLYRAARTSLEENGANTLYLALGMLVWYESDVSQKPRYAPILLIPMELVRKSVQAGYVLRHGEDEPYLNITLVEMLRQDFGIGVSDLDELPKDQSGVDVDGVLTRIRKAIMHKKRWDVLDTAYLGLFSFSKFVMWHDLRMRSKDLKRNKLVASLMAASLQWNPSLEAALPEDLDSSVHPKDLLCPMSADSSQLGAVYEATRQKSYVLHGPPGTGKSQTITNIIASAIAAGRTVLFVAEKMAALTVVQRRLEALGLGPFCLEVHSSKSKKKDILSRLQRALDSPLSSEPIEWEAEAERLSVLRNELDSYVRALHKRRKWGMSIFQTLSRLSALQDVAKAVRFTHNDVSGLTPERLRTWEELARQLQVAGQNCGHPHASAWADSSLDSYSPGLAEQVEVAGTRLSEALGHLAETSVRVFSLFGFGQGEKPCYHDVRIISRLARLFLTIPSIPGSLVADTPWQHTYSAIQEWVKHGRARDALRARLMSKYTEGTLQLDLRSLRSSLGEADRWWFLPRAMEYGRVKKVLRRTIRPGASLPNDSLKDEIDALIELRSEEDFRNGVSARAAQLLGRLWNDGNPDWDSVQAGLEWANDVHGLAADLAGTRPGGVKDVLANWGRLVSVIGETSAQGYECRQLHAFAEAADTFDALWTAFSSIVALDDCVIGGDPAAAGWFDWASERVRRWLRSTDTLRDWCAWVRVRNQSVAEGLSPLVTPIEKGLLTVDAVENAFRRGVYHSLAEWEVGREPTLKSFSRALFEDKIHEFCRIDDEYERLTRKLIYARLAARVPRMHGDASSNSEIGILARELLKQRNHMALRNLFQRIPNLLSRLTPCLLMSPMSVAQYLDPAHPPFDVVIFDEASQVPTCDAIGAIARADQAIIVGDPKQLPPTSFFMTSDSESDDEGLAIEDLESILDDCVALRMPEQRLNWHYRSRHESLIAFSNHQYYGGELLTFPSPDELTPAVSFHQVDGHYDRSKSRQNKVEAEAVVDEVVRRLKNPETAGQSIGVVTFNQPQQQIIEDMLEEKILKNPELEQYFGPEFPEPVFVKNLENVQGDERDVIIFSIGYGPDASGRVTMNFGPLNWSGGQRRLNVAASRARLEMLVFSSLSPDKIDLSRTSAQGVRDLKAFLEYAQKGRQALSAQLSVSPEAYADSPFEQQVRQVLVERGHQVHLQVGCSGYRIDLAVVDPANPRRYVLGVECDGATYHRAKTARDRDKLRQSVLEGLGWRLIRVWSTDWWENRESELKRIEDAIRETVGQGSPPDTRDIARQVETIVPPISEPMVARALIESSGTSVPQPAQARPTAETDYVVCRPTPIRGLSEEFYLPESKSMLRAQIGQVVSVEGPICFDLLARRIAEAWGMSRIGSRIQEVLQGAIRGMKLKTTRVEGTVFYWPDSVLPDEYNTYRVPCDEKDSRRGLEQVPPEETAVAALEVLRQQINLPEEDLVHETARLFGYRRTRAAAEQFVRKGVDLLVRRKEAARGKDGRVTLAK